jgi:Flp pilus assembly protein TadD
MSTRNPKSSSPSDRDSLQDRHKQFDQQQDGSVVNQDVAIDRRIADARKGVLDNPDQAVEIYTLVEALCKRGRQSEENEAVAILTKAFDSTQRFGFRERMGDIKMRQYRRKAAAVVAALKADPENQELRKTAQQIISEARTFEEQEYAARVANYPTDLVLKFEYGRRLFDNRKFAEAIPILQQAENNATNRPRAMSLRGQSFFNLKYYSEAADTFRRAIDKGDMADSDTAKEVYYHLGRALEQLGDVGGADKAYSQVVQWDFNYRDVRQRVGRLRQAGKSDSAGPVGP